MFKKSIFTMALFLTTLSNAELIKNWNPLEINIPSQKKADEYFNDFQVSKAALGYIYSVPAFYHLKQQHAFLYNFTKYMGENSGNIFGQFLLLREPVNPKMPDVMPNVDTLYGVTFLDLSENNAYVLIVPEIQKRYYSFAFVDAYFYNFDYIGSRVSGQKAGNYLIVGPNWNGKTPKGIAKIIKAPTPSINIYERIYFNDLQDIKKVNEIQNEIKLVELPKFLNPNAVVKKINTEKYLNQYKETTNPIEVIQMANIYMGNNPPPVEDKALVEYFSQSGIGPNVKVPETKKGQKIITDGIKDADEYMSGLALNNGKTVNGWQISPLIGKRGYGDFALQAMMQLRSVGLNSSDEAVYYAAYTDSNTNSLKGGKNYSITFEKGNLPPVLKDKYGFWSITVYDKKTLKLVENPENKYNIKSIDKFTYNKDGSLTIYLSSKKGSENNSNWLPIPQNGEFMLTLRIYIGDKEVIDGKYAPPSIKIE